jgi:glycosyltransferase involved in cell wall biosynthesis
MQAPGVTPPRELGKDAGGRGSAPRVLFLAEDFPRSKAASHGGVEVSLWRQAEGLAAQARVTVVSPRRSYLPLRRYRRAAAEPAWGEDAGAGRAAAPAATPAFEIRRPPVVHVPILWPVAEPIQILIAAAWIHLRHRRNFDLVHGHRAIPMGLAAVLFGRVFRRPSVVTVYGTEVNVEATAGGWLLRRGVRAALKAERVIAVSRALTERLSALGVDGARVRFVPSGVDLDLFTPGDLTPDQRLAARRALGLPVDRFIFLSLSDFYPIKGHRVLIEAMGKLARRRPAAAFLAMTGDASERPGIERRARELGLDGDVRFAGLLPYPDLPSWVNAADALVLPSLNEGMPLTVLEGFACGKPLVGSRVGGVPEVVTDERYGILVPPGDPQALADALEAAMDRSWDAGLIRERTRTFAWPAVVERILEVYRELR